MRICLLGGFEARSSKGVRLSFPTRKAEALLAVLALAPGTFHSRERLATLLWSDRGDAQARGSLRQTLSLLRKHFAAARVRGIVVEGEQLCLDPAGIAVDAAEFAVSLESDTAEGLAEALALYRGDLLDGFAMAEEPFEEWLRQERSRLRRQALQAGERLLDRCVERGDAAGLAVGERLLALEPASEPTACALMRLHSLKGSRSAVAREYERCRQTLAAELHVEPAPETTVLWRRLLAPAARPATVRSGLPSIAVLPFAGPAGDAETAGFADGLVEDIIRELSRFRSLEVIARHSAFALRDFKLTAREIGERLGARYLLSGSLRRLGPILRIGTELVETASGRQIWAERTDCEFERISVMHDEISRAVVGALALRIDEATLRQARRKPPDDLQAYDCWLRGVDCVRRGGADKLEEARAFFSRALEIDPTYARAHSGLSLSYFNEWNCSHWTIWAEREEQALESAIRAVELDDSDHVTRLILGRIYLYRRDYARAEQELSRAEALNPNDADLLAHLALGWAYLGEAERARNLAERAVRLNPLHEGWYYTFMLPAALAQRRFRDTIAIGERCLDLAVKVHAYVAAAHAHLGELDLARRHVAGYLALFRQRITHGEPPRDAEAIAWLELVNAFRRPEDLEILIDGLAKAGLSRAEEPTAASRVRERGQRRLSVLRRT